MVNSTDTVGDCGVERRERGWVEVGRDDMWRNILLGLVGRFWL